MSQLYLNPYLNLAGRAREAMEFYAKVLGGKLDLLAMDEKGGTHPAGPGESIGHSRLEADGVVIMATDGHPDYPATVGDNVAIALGGNDKERLTKVFDGLAEGGQVKMPLAEQPWDAWLGYLADKFGINWMVNIDKA
jgi:PhnB protein